jgi:hypothetical protein
MESAAALLLADVPEKLIADWQKVRQSKRAGPITETVAQGLIREGQRAGLTPEAAIQYCCEAGWQNFTASYYDKREGASPSQRRAPAKPTPGRNAGFDTKNYREGVAEDGSLI